MPNALAPDTLAAIRGEAEAARRAFAETDRAARALQGTIRSGLQTALTSALRDGAKLSDVLRGLALDIARSTANRAIGQISGQLSGIAATGITGMLGFATGRTPITGPVRAFARGGVLSGPTLFPMQGGAGLAGEAGPEAILPLQRGPDGRLGVAAQGNSSSAAPIIVHIHTPDVEGFRRSQGQVAATLARAVDRGRRNL